MTPETGSRIASAIVGMGTGTVLGLSAWLEPSARGFSTHTQLGLGECTFLTLTDYPCPMCGVTTTYALMAHLHPLQAFLNQPFGTLLFLMTVAAFGVSLAELVQPRMRWHRFAERVAPYESRLAVLFLIAMGLGWMYKIALMRI